VHNGRHKYSTKATKQVITSSKIREGIKIIFTKKKKQSTKNDLKKEKKIKKKKKKK